MIFLVSCSAMGLATGIPGWAALLREDARLDVLGPAPYPVARVNDEWRYRIAVRTKDLDALRDTLRTRIFPLAATVTGVRLSVTIDA